jgi:hypothetical protein
MGAAGAVGFSVTFLAPTVDVTVADGQSVLVTSQRAFGSNGAAATGLSLWICYQNGSAGALTPVGVGTLGLRVPAFTRVNFPMTAVLKDLAPSTYTVGLCGFAFDPSGWTSNESGSTSAVVF